MRRWLRRRQDACRLAQADAEAFIRDHCTAAPVSERDETVCRVSSFRRLPQTARCPIQKCQGLREGQITMIGTVRWFNLQKGYGFIRPDDGSPNIIVHMSAVESAGMSDLKEGRRVIFEI